MGWGNAANGPGLQYTLLYLGYYCCDQAYKFI